MMSGARADWNTFKAGWLLAGGSVAHWFSRTPDGLKADCGVNPLMMRDRLGPVAFDPGDFRKCLRCLRNRSGE